MVARYQVVVVVGPAAPARDGRRGGSPSRRPKAPLRVHIFPSRCVTPRTFLPSLSRRRAERAQSAGGREQLAVRFASGRWNEGPTRVFSEERTTETENRSALTPGSPPTPARAGRPDGGPVMPRWMPGMGLHVEKGPSCRRSRAGPVRRRPADGARIRHGMHLGCRVVSTTSLLVLGACGELHGPAWLPVAATG